DARILARKIGALAPGEKVKLTTLRNGQEKTFELTLGELPSQREARNARSDDRGSDRRRGDRDEVPRLGLSLAPAARVAGAGKAGVVVVNVDPDSPAAERGFKEGDIILEVGGKTVTSVKDVREAVADARKDSKNAVLLRLRAGDGS